MSGMTHREPTIQIQTKYEKDILQFEKKKYFAIENTNTNTVENTNTSTIETRNTRMYLVQGRLGAYNTNTNLM